MEQEEKNSGTWIQIKYVSEGVPRPRRGHIIRKVILYNIIR